MYAMIREGDGKFYTSMVFGCYKSTDRCDYANNFWIVLNKEKSALIKQPALEQNTECLMPTVIITDADQNGWNRISEYEESVDFLPTGALLSMLDHNRVPSELTRRCIEMDGAYRFAPVRAINTADDIRDLEWASGGFHDAYIAEINEVDNSLYILFDGTWGCRIEVWFNGEVSYDASSREPGKGDPYWLGSTVAIEDGFVYLIDDEDISVSEIDSSCCWFRARTMRYRVIPD